MKFVKTSFVAIIAGTLVLTGCTDPASMGSDGRNTREGAIAGGIIGGLTGLITNRDNRGRGAVVGAVIGAGTGAVLGNQLDKQEAALRNQIGNDQVRITNTGSELIVTMPQDILFGVNDASLRPDLRSDLLALADNLRQFPDSTVVIVGHTDNTGSSEFNQSLSERRANAVADVLINAGTRAGRIAASGRGEASPIATNLTPEGRAQNRRVDIIIRPST